MSDAANRDSDLINARAAVDYAMGRMESARDEARIAAESAARLREEMIAIVGERDRLRGEVERLQRMCGDHEARVGQQRQRAETLRLKHQEALHERDAALRKLGDRQATLGDLDRMTRRVRELEQEIDVFREYSV